MTSAQKSDKITAALGPAMKLARSTTFSPEKMLSSAIRSVLNCGARRILLPPAKLRSSLLKEGRCALLFVFGCSTEDEIRSFKEQSLVLARLLYTVTHI